MTTSPTTLSSVSSHPVAEELTEELEQLLDVFCSDVQQQFCLDQHVATQHQLSNIKSTIQHARTLLNGKWLLDPPQQQHIQARQSVMRTCLEMIDSYQAIAHQRQLRPLPEGQAATWMHVDWQQLSQTFDTKAREQTQWQQLLTNLRDLQKAWEGKKQQVVTKIIHSFLMTSFEPPRGCHIVLVDRHNYAQLGLKRTAIGSRQLVFEAHLLTRPDQVAIISDLCQRFATVFGENAHHNLAHIDAQLKRGQPNELHLKCQALYQQLFLPLEIDTETKSSHHSYLDPIQQQRVDQWYVNQDHQQHEDIEEERPTTPEAPPPPPPPKHDKSPPPPMTLRPTPFIDTTSLTLQHIPLPTFIPSPWQWPDLLKIRQPYRPLLFGLIKRRKKGLLSRLYQLFSPPKKTPPASPVDPPMYPVFASISMTQLGQHFIWTSQRFYQDIMLHCQLKYQQESQVLKDVGSDLVQMYAALQLDISRLAMQRVVAILHELHAMDPPEVSLDGI